jgi:ERCC4-type nuclease
MKHYYTATEYKTLLGQLRIVVDTAEKSNENIIGFFDKRKIPYIERKLKNGDYNARIDMCPKLGYPIDTYLTDEIFIERKNSLSELASSINNEAFHYELKRARNIEHKYLLVEQANGWQGLLEHDYRNKYSEKAFWGTLHTFEVEYGLRIKFLPKEAMGLAIYSICKAVLDSKILKSTS